MTSKSGNGKFANGISSSENGTEVKSSIFLSGTSTSVNKMNHLIGFQESEIKANLMGDTLVMNFDLDDIPEPIHEICTQLKIDVAVVVKHLVLKSYMQVLDNMANDSKSFKETIMDPLRTQYMIGNITSEPVKNAVYYNWITSEDMDNIEKSKIRYAKLFNRENDI